MDGYRNQLFFHNITKALNFIDVYENSPSFQKLPEYIHIIHKFLNMFSLSWRRPKLLGAFSAIVWKLGVYRLH